MVRLWRKAAASTTSAIGWIPKFFSSTVIIYGTPTIWQRLFS
jgi:hypothetical protein